ncbi:MAG: hypothetical protein NXI22_02480 [bacterium]|nr:hypothetical protein [bacterium]
MCKLVFFLGDLNKRVIVTTEDKKSFANQIRIVFPIFLAATRHVSANVFEDLFGGPVADFNAKTRYRWILRRQLNREFIQRVNEGVFEIR